MKALPSIAFNEFKGSAGDVTAKISKGRQVLSGRALPGNVTTAAQAARRCSFASISKAFKKLTDEQIQQWNTLASKMKSEQVFGQQYELTGINAFIKLNSSLAMAGQSMLTDPPKFIGNVPSVVYEDLWISPEIIIFTGLEQPSDRHELVFKMSTAMSPGISSGYDQAVIITPGMTPDWGDADLTALYTSVMGVRPETGKKYFCEFYWLDTATGFTGKPVKISAICKEGSTSGDATYVPRARITMDNIKTSEGFTNMDFEISKGSAIVSLDSRYANNTGVASGNFELNGTIENLPQGFSYVLGRCSNKDRGVFLKPCVFQTWFNSFLGKTTGTLAHRGGRYESEDVEVFGTAPMYI